MITPREIRVGNKFYYNKGWVDPTSKEVVEIRGIADGGVVLLKGKKNIGDPYKTNILLPIPITEEMLLKCGFQPKTKDNSVLELGAIPFTIEAFYDKSIIIAVEHGTTDVKHIHQLQNLYFALTNTELEIEL